MDTQSASQITVDDVEMDFSDAASVSTAEAALGGGSRIAIALAPDGSAIGSLVYDPSLATIDDLNAMLDQAQADYEDGNPAPPELNKTQKQLDSAQPSYALLVADDNPLAGEL
jgi:hypothetical protein